MDETSILRSKLQETLLKQEVQNEKVEDLLLSIAATAVLSSWEYAAPDTAEGQAQRACWDKLCDFFGGRDAMFEKLKG